MADLRYDSNAQFNQCICCGDLQNLALHLADRAVHHANAMHEQKGIECNPPFQIAVGR